MGAGEVDSFFTTFKENARLRLERAYEISWKLIKDGSQPSSRQLLKGYREIDLSPSTLESGCNFWEEEIYPNKLVFYVEVMRRLPSSI